MSAHYNIPEINSSLIRVAPVVSTARNELVAEISALIDKHIDNRVSYWMAQQGIAQWCQEHDVSVSEAATQICAAQKSAKVAVTELTEAEILVIAADNYDDGWNHTGCVFNYKMKPSAGKKYYGYCGEGHQHYCPTHILLKACQVTLKKILETVGFDLNTIHTADIKARKIAMKKKSNELKVVASGGTPNVPQMRVMVDTGAALPAPVKTEPKYVPFHNGTEVLAGYVIDEVSNLVGKENTETGEVRIVGLFDRGSKATRGLTATQKAAYISRGFVMDKP